MNTEDLNRLLEKYYNGESTVEEEESLKALFTGGSVPPGYEAEKDIFSYYSDPVEIPEPDADFEAKMVAGIDEYEKHLKSLKFRNFAIFGISTAAGLIIMIGSYFFFTEGGNKSLDTYTDPEIAYAETIKILMDVSAQFNKGTSTLEPVGMINDVKSISMDALQKPARSIEKNLKNLEYLNASNVLSETPVDKK